MGARTNGESVNWYGFKFSWTPYHQMPDELSHYLYTFDHLSAQALDALDSLCPSSRKDNPHSKDTFNILKECAHEDPHVRELLQEIHTVPHWIDWDQIERGQRVLWRYALPSITCLIYMSLLGGMSSSRTVETLDRTGSFGCSSVRRRILETAQHALYVHKDLKSIQPGGEGWESSIRVRLLHSSVRRRIMQLAKEHPDYYDIDKYGIPINDLDCIGTISLYSSCIIWLGLPQQGIYLSERETADYLALWRYVAYLMGVPHEWMKTPEESRAMMESLLISEYKPNRKSSILANNILHGIEGQPPMYASRQFLGAQAWWLNGSELSQALEIRRPSLYYTALMASQCFYFRVLSSIIVAIPFLESITTNFSKKLCQDIFVQNKSLGALGYKTKFTFKWIPNLIRTTTPPGGSNDDREKHSAGFNSHLLERVALLNLMFISSVGIYLGYLFLRAIHCIYSLFLF
ncbi:unnamed protein product [Clonostachys chloroleuca]|uniref:ER-bound oxygenase mpaB/mpaB'/Rubber oxygenase catalytic domain-containing protein n=1 Tax=Clonostachys chloroleuca TaxID=1926264 RepID=A0AA35QC43_9HYPO|nr:unnamed protein product [Clonostachys chloroleuca]